MQNVVNLKTPFIDLDGKPIVAGRVTFCEPDTDTETRLIHIYDKDGTELQNPLPLGENGYFATQPFVTDGIEYKMIVEWDEGGATNSYTMDSKLQNITVNYEGAAVVNSIAELRLMDSDEGKAFVLGYFDAGDFCPPRLFQWVEEELSENYGTHIRSTVQGQQNTGCWICEPSGFVDIRWFGIAPDTDSDSFQRLNKIHSEYPNIPAYFPSGTWKIGSSLTMNSVILDRNTLIKDYNDEHSVLFSIANLENRGGKFCANDNEPESLRVIPVLKGLLRTSWLNGTLNEFLDSESAISGLEEIIFDSEVVEGEVEIELSGKRIVAIHDIPSSIDVSGSLVYTPSSDDLKLDKLSFHDTAFSIEHGVNLLKIQDGNSTIAMFNGNNARFFANILGNALLTHFSSSQGIAKFSISGDPWDNILALFMDRAKIDTLRVSDIRGESLNEEHIAPVVGPNFPNGFQSSIQMLMDGHVRKGANSRIDSFPIAGKMRHIVKDDDDYVRTMITINNFKELLHFDDTYSGNLGERVLLIDSLVSTEHTEFTLYYSCVAQAGRYLHVKLIDGTTETTIAKIGQNSRVTFVYEDGAWNADFFRI